MFWAVWPSTLSVWFLLFRMYVDGALLKFTTWLITAERDTIVARLVGLQIWANTLLSNKSLFKGEQFSVWALKENCLNSIKVATHSDMSWEFKEKLWPSVWNSDCRARGKPYSGPRWIQGSGMTAVCLLLSPITASPFKMFCKNPPPVRVLCVCISEKKKIKRWVLKGRMKTKTLKMGVWMPSLLCLSSDSSSCSWVSFSKWVLLTQCSQVFCKSIFLCTQGLQKAWFFFLSFLQLGEIWALRRWSKSILYLCQNKCLSGIDGALQWRRDKNLEIGKSFLFGMEDKIR